MILQKILTVFRSNPDLRRNLTYHRSGSRIERLHMAHQLDQATDSGNVVLDDPARQDRHSQDGIGVNRKAPNSTSETYHSPTRSAYIFKTPRPCSVPSLTSTLFLPSTRCTLTSRQSSLASKPRFASSPFGLAVENLNAFLLTSLGPTTSNA